MDAPVLSLLEFNLLVRQAVEYAFPGSFFITAEIAALNVDAKGHCYLELVEKDEKTIKAQMRAMIWASLYRTVSAAFQKATGIALAKGLKILVKATFNFHERYGPSLTITAVDPSYTLGEMARKRKEILDRLYAEGIAGNNKALPFPAVPLRIAVISSKKAAGYEDFIKHLDANSYGYRFTVLSLPALMQGDGAEESIVAALKLCEGNASRIDVVVIVRGGGGAADLDCFDSYAIGKRIALLPVPVISGIGHERDRTVVDEVSHTTVKTPTAAAVLLIERVKAFEDALDTLARTLLGSTSRLMSQAQQSLQHLSASLTASSREHLLKESFTLEGHVRSLSLTRRIVSTKYKEISTVTDTLKLLAGRDLRAVRLGLDRLSRTLGPAVKRLLHRQQEHLEAKTGIIRLLNPLNVLKRGYSITYHKGACHEGAYHRGALVRCAQDVAQGDIIHTLTAAGTVESTVIATEEETATPFTTMEEAAQ